MSTLPKIVTTQTLAPVPSFDWMATRGDYDLDCLVGYGATEEEAIAELLEMEEDRR
jgi:hypothetical protein